MWRYKIANRSGVTNFRVSIESLKKVLENKFKKL